MERPILFNTEMVRAILDGRKTQTRRIIKLAHGFDGRPVGESGNPDNPIGFMYPCGIKRPPCNKGDILWVRETWCPCASLDSFFDGKNLFVYKADYAEHSSLPCGWKPSIHMPKEAARIFLRVKDVRAERLQDISFHDVAAEGVDDVEPCDDDELLCEYCPLENEQKGVHNYGSGPVMCEGARCEEAFDAWVEDFIANFSTIWDSTIKPSDIDCYGWEANPWVWVIEFERCEPPKED